MFAQVCDDLTRKQYCAGPNHDPVAWWYVSGYAAARAGCSYGFAVAFAIQPDELKVAYQQGWEDGKNDREAS